MFVCLLLIYKDEEWGFGFLNRSWKFNSVSILLKLHLYQLYQCIKSCIASHGGMLVMQITCDIHSHHWESVRKWFFTLPYSGHLLKMQSIHSFVDCNQHWPPLPKSATSFCWWWYEERWREWMEVDTAGNACFSNRLMLWRTPVTFSGSLYLQDQTRHRFHMVIHSGEMSLSKEMELQVVYMQMTDDLHS